MTAKRSPKPIDRTGRQAEILAHVADGLEYAEIAATMGFAKITIKREMVSLMAQHGARNRAHLIALAYRAGLLKVPQ